MKNPLIATPIVDSLGRQTTVHKRADTGSSTSNAIPGPALAAPSGQTQREVDGYFKRGIDQLRLSPDMRRELLSTLHPDTLPLMATLIENKTDELWMQIATDWSTDNSNFSVLNSHVLLTSESDDRSDEWQKNALYTLMGIKYIGVKYSTRDDVWAVDENQDVWIDFTDPDDSRVEGAKALFNAVMDNDNYNLTTLRTIKHSQCAKTFEEPLVGNYIMDHPDRAQEIVDLFRDRGTCDEDVFDAVLNSDVPALNDGIL